MKNLSLVLIAIALTFNACTDTQENKTTTASTTQKPALPIKTYEVSKGTTTLSKTYPAIIKPFEEVDITARVSGNLKEMFFKEGDFVKKGQALYTIEQDIYKANLNQAKASFKKANKDYQRAQSLRKSKSISVQSYDNYVFVYEDAKAKLDQAQIQFDYTNITSPINGIVGIKTYDVGDFVGSNSDNSTLITITSIDPIHVEFELTKSDISSFLSQIKQGQGKINLLSNDKVYAGGQIDYISPKLNAQTDTLLLRAKFSNTDHELLVGEFTKLQIANLSIPDVFVVPENAILKTAKGDFVYIVKENTANLKPVVVGSLLDKGIIIKQGLEEKDLVVISNLAKLRPNTKVQIINNKEQ